MELIFKRLGKEEQTAALEIAQGLPEFFTKAGLNSLEKDLKEHEAYGACMGHKMLGFIALHKVDEKAVELSWLAVEKRMQGQGVGSTLVREVLNRLAERGVSLAYVKTLAETVRDEGYAKTRAFYKRLGFQRLEIINPYPGWEPGNPCQILVVGLPLQ